MAGVFVIQEMRAIGGRVEENADGARFVWSVKNRNIPKRPWALPTELRKVRTDYPSARQGSAQILGTKRGPSTLEGYWDDRYVSPGYAKAEFDRFQKMVDRGNPVRVTFQELSFDCLLEHFEPKYHRAEYIEYSFTLDNYGPQNESEQTRMPETIASADQAFDDTSFVAQAALETNRLAPVSKMAAGLKKDVDGFLTTISENLDKLAGSITTRRGVLKPIGEFSKTATMFRMVGGDASNVINRLISVRSDVEMIVRTGVSVLDFEAWSRGLRTQMRILRGQSDKAANNMEKRAAAPAVGYYRPRAGEHLYHISRKVYGTPHGWRTIYARNRLTSLRLTGEETLIIPERGPG
jgi:nucleoid-associated protein YgaU